VSLIKCETLQDDSVEEDNQLESRQKRDLEVAETVGKGGAAAGAGVVKGAKVKTFR